MPELPEVETTVRELNKKVKGKTILDVWTDYSSNYKHYKDQVKNPKYFSGFKKRIEGKKIKEVKRRGKNILIHLSSGDVILIHMKMTGHLIFGKYIMQNKKKKSTIQNLPEKWEKETWIPDEPHTSPLWDSYNRHIHLVFSLSGGRKLILSDARKFARVRIIDRDELENIKEIQNLGPNPLDIPEERFIDRLNTRQSGKIKQVLMDQNVLAGIGNIYSDEALWKVGVLPASNLKKIPRKELGRLYKAVQDVLKKGIAFGGDSTSDYRAPDGKKGSFQHKHNVYRKKGEKCSMKKCSGIIKRSVVGGRSTHFCDTHQKKY